MHFSAVPCFLLLSIVSWTAVLAEEMASGKEAKASGRVTGGGQVASVIVQPVGIPFGFGTHVVGTGGTVARSSSASGQAVSIAGPGVSFSRTSVRSGPISSGGAVSAVQFVPTIVSGGGTGIPTTTGETVPVSVGVSRTPTRTLADGTKVRDCFDFMVGLRAHGEEFNRGNSFRYKCNDGKMEIIACIGTQRANRAIIPLGDTVTVNGFWHKCEYFENNQTVRYSQERSCLANGMEMKIGDTFRSGSFNMKCEETGFSIAGCVYYDSNGKPQVLNLGQTADVGNTRHHCEEDAEVKGRVKYYTNAINCVKDGETYREGDVWQKRYLRYKCGKNGAVDIIGCSTKEDGSGKNLDIGEDYVFNQTVHRCYKRGLTVYYHQYACGYPNTPSCEPKPIPENAAPTGVQIINLSPGWQLLDSNGNPVSSLGNIRLAPGESFYGTMQMGECPAS